MAAARKLRIRFNGWKRSRTVAVEFLDYRADWAFEQSATGGTIDHPVTQFRALAADTIDRIDRALVAVHGEPEEPE